MSLMLFNSLTKTKEKFIPIDKEKVTMYVCGPTVYSAPHLGNGLSVVVFDLLFRVLRFIYGDKEVLYVRNITDVDDKINDAAKARNITIQQLTEEVTKIFHQNTNYMNCLEPSIEPKVTDHISEIIYIIKLLLENGYAYEANNHVYFSVGKDLKYGKLAGRKIEELLAGVRVDVAEEKEHFADFVLWKPADEEDDESAVFDSPWGKGRPGWHIECSAMSHKYLGVDFDIHGGGVDLIFPHHTNEIAQSTCAFKGSKYAKYWVHNGFLTVDGEKMSKSLNNFITILELQERKIEGEVVRFHILSSHYRKPMDWNDHAIHEAKKILDNFYRATEIIEKENIHVFYPLAFIDALLDDLNTPKAYKVLHELYHNINKSEGEEKLKLAMKLKICCNFLGFLEKTYDEWFSLENIDIEKIESLVKARNKAKLESNFEEADNIRTKLAEMEIILEDKADGSTIWRKK